MTTMETATMEELLKYWEDEEDDDEVSETNINTGGIRRTGRDIRRKKAKYAQLRKIRFAKAMFREKYKPHKTKVSKYTMCRCPNKKRDMLYVAQNIGDFTDFDDTDSS